LEIRRVRTVATSFGFGAFVRGVDGLRQVRIVGVVQGRVQSRPRYPGSGSAMNNGVRESILGSDRVDRRPTAVLAENTLSNQREQDLLKK
jgi:hypothetical protein